MERAHGSCAALSGHWGVFAIRGEPSPGGDRWLGRPCRPATIAGTVGGPMLIERCAVITPPIAPGALEGLPFGPRAARHAHVARLSHSLQSPKEQCLGERTKLVADRSVEQCAEGGWSATRRPSRFRWSSPREERGGEFGKPPWSRSRVPSSNGRPRRSRGEGGRTRCGGSSTSRDLAAWRRASGVVRGRSPGLDAMGGSYTWVSIRVEATLFEHEAVVQLWRLLPRGVGPDAASSRPESDQRLDTQLLEAGRARG